MNGPEGLELFDGLRDRDYAARGLMVIEGRILLDKALDAGLSIEAALCMPADRPSVEARSGGAFPVHSRPAPEIAELVGFGFHRGVLALARRPALPEPARVATPDGDLLVLWNVTDPENLGLLSRSAAALGAAAIALGPGCADPYSRKALRTSMGNLLTRPLLRVDVAGLAALRGPDRLLVAAALGPRSRELRGFDPGGRAVALALGNEGYGLPDEAIEVCDEVLVVPMASGVDSLNVAAAGAIMMWELFGKSPA
ncbi:MAG: RNA methyltransferase [Spirochaetales bacterium]|nr:RNA methyltransferase [Spirochaetales bacterium]